MSKRAPASTAQRSGPKLCSEPGCTVYVIGGSGVCHRHAGIRTAKRRNARLEAVEIAEATRDDLAQGRG